MNTFKNLLNPSRLSVFAALAFALTSPSRAILDTNTNAVSDVWEKQYNATQPVVSIDKRVRVFWSKRNGT